jgi:hypothetical protein
VHVVEEPFEDVGEKDAKGRYSYYYSGVILRLVFPTREFRARRYDQTPGEAAFLAIVTTPEATRCPFQEIPYDDTEFREAACYLRDTIGADTVKILLPGGYTAVEFAHFPGVLPSGLDTGEEFHCFQCRALIPQEQNKCPRCGWRWQ